MKLLVLVFYTTLISSTVVDLAATTTAAAATKPTTATATTTTIALPRKISSHSSTSTSKITPTQPQPPQKVANGTRLFCSCLGGFTIALPHQSSTTESQIVSTDSQATTVNTLTDTPSKTVDSSTGDPAKSLSPSTGASATTLSPSKGTPTDTSRPSTGAPATTLSSPAGAPSTTLSPSTDTPATTLSPSTGTLTDTLSPSTDTPATTLSPSTDTPATSLSPSTDTPATSLSPSTGASATTLSPSTDTPATSLSPSTDTPATSLSPPTDTPATSLSPSTGASATTLSPSTGAPVTTLSSSTDTPATSLSPSTGHPSQIVASTEKGTEQSSLPHNTGSTTHVARRRRADRHFVHTSSALNQTTQTITEITTVSTLEDNTNNTTDAKQDIYSSMDPRCFETCRAHSTTQKRIITSEVDSTTVTTSATKPTTVMQPDIAPKWDNGMPMNTNFADFILYFQEAEFMQNLVKSWRDNCRQITHFHIQIYNVKLEIALAIVINHTFHPDYNNPKKEKYKKLKQDFERQLRYFYSNTPHFNRIDIQGFSNGSIKCDYSIVLDTKNLTKQSLDTVIKYINDNRTKELNEIKMDNFGPVLVKETKALMQSDLQKAENSFKNLCVTYGDKMCEYDRKCRIITAKDYQEPYCVYKCNLEENSCGEHGTCSVDENGKIACKCKEDPLYVFHGERCDIKEEKLLLSKNYIIAIAAGGGGAVILILFIAMICLCRKWNKANKASQFYRNRSTKSPRDRESVAYEDDKGIQMENSRIENVYMSEHGHENNGFAVDSAAPSADGSSMRYEKGRYYRVVKDPELGSDTLIYQPSNLNRPIQRESTISKDEEPDPLRSHYDYIDTDTVYKIKRPNVRSNTIDSNGHPRTVL